MEQPRKLVPPIYLLLALVAMGALHFLIPLATIVPPPYTYLGAAVVVAGIAITA